MKNDFSYCCVCGKELEEPNSDGICLDCLLPNEHMWIVKIVEDGNHRVIHSFNDEPDLAIHDNILCYSLDSEYVVLPVNTIHILKKEILK